MECQSSFYLRRIADIIVEIIIFLNEKQIVKKDYTNLESRNVY